MIKVSVMYANKPGARFDHAYYRDKHMELAPIVQISEVVVGQS